jgi:type I restriction enzyme R subunit
MYSFYKKDELEKLIQHRTPRPSLTTAHINPSIADRYYQIEAIHSVGRLPLYPPPRGSALNGHR